MQTPMVDPGLLASTRNIENKSEDLRAHFLNRGIAGSDPAGIDVDKIVPPHRQSAVGGKLDHRSQRKSLGSPSAIGENVQVHRCRELQRAADEIAGRRGRKDHTLWVTRSPGPAIRWYNMCSDH